MLYRKIVLSICLLALASCSSEKPVAKNNADKKKQEIESEMKNGELNITINEDESSAKKFIAEYFSKMPKPVLNKAWVRNNFIPAENLKLNKVPSDYSTVSIGSKPKRGFEITSQPIIAEGKIFTLGGQGEFSARKLSDKGEVIWKTILEEEFLQESRKDYDWLDDVESVFKDKDEFLGGNICYSRGRVFVSTKRGEVYAVDASSGKLVWKKSLNSPVRSSPVAKNNILVVTTSDSKTYALNTKTGKRLWMHEGAEEKAKFVTAPTPLIIGDKVIVSYPSGEVFALNLDDGGEIWMAITSPDRITQLLPTNNDISYSPIYHNGLIYVVSSNGNIFALQEETGEEIWQLSDMAIVHSPWPTGDYLFAISRFGQLFAVSSQDGEVIWKTHLADPKDIDDDNLVFTPPVIANNNIYVADNEGKLRSYSPRDGKLKKETKIPSNVYQQPAVADGRIFFVSNKSDLIEIE